ncbi:putative intergrin alpha chain protein [Trypanosoma vivax]|nr:putative intergrin alpha chain protein [Trypanosoma vivax]
MEDVRQHRHNQAVRDSKYEAQRIPAVPFDAWAFRNIVPQGSLMPNALVVSDVDGDGAEELVIGSTEGHLHVLKVGNRVPVYTRSVTATISVVLYRSEQQRLVIATLEGQCEVTEGFLGVSSKAARNDGVIALSQRSSATSLVTNPRDWKGSSSKPETTEECYSSTSSFGGCAYRAMGASYVFCIPPNCVCGDISAADDDNIVFLGSYDGHVYVYRLSPAGTRLGSLFLQSQMSSMKSFIVPHETGTHSLAANDPLGPSGARATVMDHGMVTVSTRALLLVYGSERVVLLSSSLADVVQWGMCDQPGTVAKPGQASQATPRSPYVSSSDVCQASQSLVDLPHLGTTEEKEESLLLEPLWQFSLCRLSKHQQLSMINHRSNSRVFGRSHEHITLLSSEGDSSFLANWNTSLSICKGDRNTHGTEQCAMSGSCHSSLGIAESMEESAEAEADIEVRCAGAVDVSVGAHSTQFAVSTEDGRWFIFEMLLTGSGSATAKVDVEAAAQLGGSPLGNKAAAVSNQQVSIACVLSGCLKNDGFVQRVSILQPRDNVFITIFLGTHGTCYAVDAKNGIWAESYVKEDALSFAVMTSTPPPQGTTTSQLHGFSLSFVSVDSVTIVWVGDAICTCIPSPAPCTPASASAPAQNNSQSGVVCDSALYLVGGKRDADVMEEKLMLELGTILFGGHETEMERRFAARKLCAHALTANDWEQLWQWAL